jgi:NADP-dependent aldehyde dehydrogenase
VTGKNYIGSDLSAQGNQFFKTFNPIYNSDNPTVFIQATPTEVSISVALASYSSIFFSATQLVTRRSVWTMRTGYKMQRCD